MEKLSAGQLHLADQRGVIEHNGLTRWCTFNFGEYFNAERMPFGSLLTLNDELFAPAHIEKYQPEQNVWVVIVPITGEVGYRELNGAGWPIDVGQVQARYVQAGSVIEVYNPYDNERINFLYLEFAAAEIEPLALVPHVFGFDLEGKQNLLVDIIPGTYPDGSAALPFTMHIGMFDGRGETIYQMQKTNSLFYAFVIAGAFELQGRLMHKRDGLALWDLQEADMEALSNNAVLLVIEIKKP